MEKKKILLSDGSQTEICYEMPSGIPKAIVQGIPDLYGSAEELLASPLFAALKQEDVLICAASLTPDQIVPSVCLPLLSEVKYEWRKTYRFLPYIVYGAGYGASLAASLVSEKDAGYDGAVFSDFVGVIDGRGKMQTFLDTMKSRFGSEEKRRSMAFSRLLGQAAPGEKDDTYRASALEAALALVDTMTTEDFIASVPLSLPVLLIAHQQDKYGVNGEDTEWMHELLSDAELCELKLMEYESMAGDAESSEVTGWVESVCEGVVLCGKGWQ